MDKRATGRLSLSRRGSNFTLRDSNHKERSIPCCNRLGCSTRFYSMNDSPVGNPEKSRLPKTSSLSMSSKSLGGRSSNSLVASSNYRKPQQERGNITPLQEAVGGSESINRQVETLRPNTEDIEPTVLQGFSENVTETLETRGIDSSSKSQKNTNLQPGSGNQDSSSSLSIRHSTAYRIRKNSQTNRHVSHGAVSGAQSYGLKSNRSTLKSDGFGSGCSSSDCGHNQMADMVRKRSSDGEISAARGKDVTTSSNRGYSGSRHRDISSQDRLCPMPEQVSRKSRNWPTGSNSVSLSLPKSFLTSELRPKQFPISESDVPESSSECSSIEIPPVSGSSNRTARIRPISQLEINDLLGDRDDYQHFNMEEIKEVLWALERVDQNQELTQEQFLVLEASLSLGGFSFHDQHRDMRLDIDNMSYEELLDLEEKMGTVSTALTEEALSKHIRRIIYNAPSHAIGIISCRDDDTKCSICQEEYVVGDELGKLICSHNYHSECIHQWLSQKNWCPICKASVCSS